MPPRAVVCQLCGGKFFAASLAHHQKACQKKVGKQLHECPYCKAGVPMLEMDSHVMRCPAARAAGAKPTGASAALARRLNNHARGAPQAGEQRAAAGGGNGMGGIPEYAEDDDVRIECQSCGRKFNMDRVAKHQAICEKLATKKPRRKFKTQREYVEGGQGGAVVGVAKHMSKPDPEPCKSNWRKESAAWREACRAARSDPVPQRGRSSDQPSRRAPSPAPGNPRSSGTGGRSPQARARGAGAAASPGPTRRGLPARSPGPEARAPRAAAAAPAQRRAPSVTSAPARVPDGFAAIVIKEQFRLLDANGDGRLDPEELAALLRSGSEMTDREIQSLFDSIDKDRNGRIEFAEFVDFVFSEEGALPLGGTAGGTAGAATRTGGAAPRRGPPASPVARAGGGTGVLQQRAIRGSPVR
uniref:Calmodulin n=1 Tax=Alexandrium monilatum TaxID=311494 RepID=A0A7S4UMR7_9DINO